MTWLRFMPSSMIRAVSVTVAAGAALLKRAPAANNARFNDRMSLLPPNENRRSANQHAGGETSIPGIFA
jgi:hypothetical protein